VRESGGGEGDEPARDRAPARKKKTRRKKTHQPIQNEVLKRLLEVGLADEDGADHAAAQQEHAHKGGAFRGVSAVGAVAAAAAAAAGPCGGCCGRRPASVLLVLILIARRARVRDQVGRELVVEPLPVVAAEQHDFQAHEARDVRELLLLVCFFGWGAIGVSASEGRNAERRNEKKKSSPAQS
jgi:hypothetical protein